MLRDRYGLVLSTGSVAARDAYVEAMDLFLGANAGAEQGFARAALEDPSFALAHAGQARALQMRGRGREAADAMGAARAAADGCSDREAGHLNALGLLIAGDGPGAYATILAHLGEWPLDAMIAQPCCGVFGLIGFSGRPGREAEQLAFTDRLSPHYGDDWWFLAQHGFSQVEAGQVAEAERLLERALAGNPRNANAAHIRAHVHYEAGELKEGLARLDAWRRDYDPEAQLSCHIAWHVAIWRAAEGDLDEAWRVFEADVAPGGAWGPPINVLTDSAAFVLRAELAGAAVPDGTWERLSDYAGAFFPNPGIAFADIHAALAHAMAGRGDALMRIVEAAAGPAGDMVSGLAEALGAYARSDWEGAIWRLAPWMATHERVGGSRAQRDLLEFALLGALLRSGRTEEARRLLVLRRPVHAPAPPLAALRMAA